MMMMGDQLGEMLTGSKSTCKKCGKTFSFDEGFTAAHNKGITDKVVMCPKCRTVYTVQMGLGSMALIDDVSERYKDKIGSGCFVATAVYGSYDHPSVIVLRNWRDSYLLKTMMGRCFTSLYYILGPTMAHFAALNPFIRCSVRRLLDFTIRQMQHTSISK